METRQIRVALVTPFDWGIPSAVNYHVADLARFLVSAGHRPTILACSSYAPELRRMRALLRRNQSLAASRLEAWGAGAPPASDLLPSPGFGPLNPEDGIPVMVLGPAVPVYLSRSLVSVSLPVDVTARLERLLAFDVFDVLHVHEPFSPSLGLSALRLSRCPTIATFHFTSVGLFSYEHAKGFVQRATRHVDRAIVTTNPARQVAEELVQAECRVVPLPTDWPVLRAAEHSEISRARTGVDAQPSVLYVYRGDDRRNLAILFRALARYEQQDMPNVTVAVHRPSGEVWPPAAEPRRLRGKVRWKRFDSPDELAPAVGEGLCLVLPILGGDWLVQSLEDAVASELPVAAPNLPVCQDVLGENAGYFLPERETSVIRAIAEASARGKAPARKASGIVHGQRWAFAGQAFLEEYEAALQIRKGRLFSAGRRKPITVGTRTEKPQYPLRGPADRIYVDLHVHTSYSKDSASRVEAVIQTALDIGLGAIAIADHNTIAGAIQARELAPDGLTIIVAEEIKTKQGEVIGLFLRDEVPSGLDFHETLEHIKAQGGLVYIPHPFDGLHKTPSYRSLASNAHRIDVVEVFNARLALPTFNTRAERFATKYNIAAGAGSDAHVLQGLGTAMVLMKAFSTPEEFMEGLREADIIANRKSVLYLTSLKFLLTSLDRMGFS